MRQAGRPFLQIPGPTNVPDLVLRATAMQTIDHRSAEFGRLGRRVLQGIKTNFNCCLFGIADGRAHAKIADRVLRIRHLGDFNDLMLAGAPSGVEMRLQLAGVPLRKGGVQAALD